VIKPGSTNTQPTKPNIAPQPPVVVKETAVASNNTHLGGAFRDIEKSSTLSIAVGYLKDK